MFGNHIHRDWIRNGNGRQDSGVGDEEMTQPYDPDFKDPCLTCTERSQACAYMLDGHKPEDGCLTKRVWIRHQAKKVV